MVSTYPTCTRIPVYYKYKQHYQKHTTQELKFINTETIFATLLFLAFLFQMIPTFLAGGITDFDDNAMYSFINQGIAGYDGTAASLGPIPTFFLQVAQWFASTILPCLGIYAIFMTVVHLCGSTVYLINPVFFDQVDEAHDLRNGGGGGKGIGGIVDKVKSLYNDKGIFGIIKAYLPNVKRICFNEALGDIDGQPTLADFFKYNFCKYCVIFMLCVLIMDKTLIDLFMKGATVGAYFFRRAAYSYDYVTTIDNFITAGADYDPTYNTKNQVEANEYKVFTAIYTCIKSDKNADLGHTENDLYNFGQKVENYVNTIVHNGMPEKFTYKDFAVQVRRVEIGSAGATNAADGLFYVPYTQFGLQSTNSLFIKITAKAPQSADASITTYKMCWLSGGQQALTTPPTKFDFTKNDSGLGANTSSNTSKALAGKVNVRYIDKTGKTTTASLPVEGNAVTLSPPADVYKIIISAAGLYRNSSTTEQYNFSQATWVNPNVKLDTPASNPKA